MDRLGSRDVVIGDVVEFVDLAVEYVCLISVDLRLYLSFSWSSVGVSQSSSKYFFFVLERQHPVQKSLTNIKTKIT